MKQSISEVFTLDVLQNYNTFKRYFQLVKNADDDKVYETGRTLRALTNYVDLQPHSIETKTKIMLEHFIRHTAKTIGSRGRAMLITRSRLHCVRYKQEFDKQMREMNLPYGCLVAFSGAVHDTDNDQDYTENGMNGLPPGVSIPDTFKSPEYRILIVSNKFQTGFDEPMLHTMYVDKRLEGLQCVQALSRLNRVVEGKTDTLVLDFVNEPDANTSRISAVLSDDDAGGGDRPQSVVRPAAPVGGFQSSTARIPSTDSASSFMTGSNPTN